MRPLFLGCVGFPNAWVSSRKQIMSFILKGGHNMPMPRKPRSLCACGCGREVPTPEGEFFSNQCQQDLDYRNYVDRWKEGLEPGTKGIFGAISNQIKRYLREKYSDQCSECGWSKRHPLTGKVPLEVDHLNGDWRDNSEVNLRLVCPNCHALTQNFRNLNKGNGRAARRKMPA